MAISRRGVLLGGVAAAAGVLLPPATALGGWRTRCALERTFLTGFPSRPWLEEVVHASSGLVSWFESRRPIYWHELQYRSCGRWRRCFVVAPTIRPAQVVDGMTHPGTNPVLAVCLPGSNDNTDGDGSGANDGAWDLMQDVGEGELQFQWPLHLVNDNDIFAVLIDGPLFGLYQYPDLTVQEDLVDEICGVEAARWFLSEYPAYRYYSSMGPSLATFVGGLSGGAIRGAFLAAALRDCMLAYLAGGQMDKAYDLRPRFNPSDWAAGDKNYADMLKAAGAQRIRIMFGGNGADYLYSPFQPGIDAILEELVRSDPIKFSVHINWAVGHQIDLDDIRSWFAANIGLMLNTLPEYVAAS